MTDLEFVGGHTIIVGTIARYSAWREFPHLCPGEHCAILRWLSGQKPANSRKADFAQVQRTAGRSWIGEGE